MEEVDWHFGFVGLCCSFCLNLDLLWDWWLLQGGDVLFDVGVVVDFVFVFGRSWSEAWRYLLVGLA